MAEDAGALLGPKALGQIGKTVREVARRIMNEQPHRARWLRAGSSGSTQIISFAIVSSDPTLRSALVEVRQKTFTGLAYGEDPDTNTLTVYDTDGCFLNEPNVDLTGRLGKAVLMYVDSEAEAAHFADSYEVPLKYWNVLSLCCPNIVCE